MKLSDFLPLASAVAIKLYKKEAIWKIMNTTFQGKNKYGGQVNNLILNRPSEQSPPKYDKF